jgi:hypothetical protein
MPPEEEIQRLTAVMESDGFFVVDEVIALFVQNMQKMV